MLKRILIIALAFYAFLSTGCHREEEQEGFSALPSLHLTMTPLQIDSIIIDQDNKVSPYAVLIDAQGATLFEGKLAHFKTRGNNTFDERKKPFAIKFPEKQSLFGLERSKSFVLLANACDESHIRNAIALDLARAFGISAPRYAYLSLYVNDSYWGLFQITNKVDVGKNALDITDLEKRNEWYNPKPLDEYEWYGKGRKKQAVQRKGVMLDNDPDDITGGYLLDNCGSVIAYSKSVSGFVSEARDNIRIRSPKHASRREVDYIAERYNEMESAVLASDGIHPKTGKHYSEYLDVESFARYYLLNELLWNHDGGWASFMMYKDADFVDPKIYAGPAWDFDRTLDNPMFHQNSIAYANELIVDEKKGKTGLALSGGLLHHLCKHEDFQHAVADCYLNEIGPVCHCYLEESPFDSLASLLSYEADRDNKEYRIRLSADYETAVHRATDFLRERIAFFDWYYSSLEEGHVFVNYTLPDHTCRKFYYPLGEPVFAPQLTPVVYNNDMVFELYYPETDSIVPDGTVFHSPQKLGLRQRQPTKHEVQMRRIKKKFKKIGLDF
ncbi:MAG: CotH kinase family protein [Bacteroidales bacterium]|nr:CotH kinase family protein [Bacteroidales bacterium]